MLMTYEEIKNAMLEGKILYRDKKDGTKVEYKSQAGKFLRRETRPGVVPGVWHNADICTMSRYEWNIIENQEETKMKQEEPTTDIIRQVPLGDGTTTVITEKVPVSQAPIIVDPFDSPKVKEDLMAIKEKAEEIKAMDTYTRYSSTIYDGRKALLIILDFENKYAVDINDPTRVYRYSKEYGVVECGNAGIQDDKWDVSLDLNDFLTSEFRIITDPLDWKQAVEKVCEFDGRAAISIATGARIVYRDEKVYFEDGLTQEDMASFWIIE